jgi:HSP20 family protein
MAWLPWRREGGAEAEHPVSRLRREMSRMFDDFLRALPAAPWSAEAGWGPALDVRETDSDVVVDLDVPGLRPEELDVSVAGGTLTIRGERKSEREEKGASYHVRERSRGSFRRAVTLPPGVDVDKASSKFEGGVLTITLPKTEQAKSRKIKIKA